MIKDFSFPYDPYPIQIEFMNNLYDGLFTCKGGLFESPTGTGKTLSVICASLTFLYDKYNSLLNDSNLSPDPIKKVCLPFPLPPEDSLATLKQRISSKMLDPDNKVQILYLSRTHSQLDQFTDELKKTKWGQRNLVRLIRLASRSQICINPEVNQDKSMIDYNCKNLIGKAVKENSANEEEEDDDDDDDDEGKGGLVKNKQTLLGFYKKKVRKEQSKCPFFERRQFVANEILDRICDIEDLVRVGSTVGGCPYYGTREGFKDADFILAPYSSVLNKHNRSMIGLDLTKCHIIIDESHNLIQAIIDSHSSSLTRQQISVCLQCFELYKETYETKMLPRKLLFVERSIKILIALKSLIQKNERKQNHTEERQQFLNSYKLTNLNFFEIWDFYEEVSLPQKVFNIRRKPANQARIDLMSLKVFQEFILCMNDKGGEFILNKDQTGEMNIKFLLLNPYKKFKKMLNESASIFLAGGTLSPHQEFVQLFESVPRPQFKNFSCGHIVPSNQLLVSCIGRSAKNIDLKFVYDNREDPVIFNELGDILYDLCCVVPNGVVVFVPSYGFLMNLQQMLCESAIPKISQKKEVFFDSRDQNILKAFSEAAEGRGAILFAVVRGSLSEGINFSDRLGRCVVVIGMPYLNKSDPEVQSKMKYYDKMNGYSGIQYYENACEVAINQSIGRAIRHIRDYAAIILLDNRHINKLSRRPKWMHTSMAPNLNYSGLITALQEFFRNKN